MTTPNHPSIRYAPFLYPAGPGFYPWTSQNAVNAYVPQHIPSLSHQLPCQYFLAPQSYPLPAHSYPFNVAISPGMGQMTQVQQQAVTQAVHRPT